MAKSIRILILEDNPVDAELIQFELQEAGLIITPKVATTKKDFVHELQDFSPDLILSDYDLPQYNGALALAEAQTRCPDTPFILVTGAVSEDRAIEILTQGAKDYVLKTKLQQRLAPAVRRALAEAEEHRARRQAEEELRLAHRTLEKRVQIRTAELEAEMAARMKMEAELRRSEEKYRLLFKNMTDGFALYDLLYDEQGSPTDWRILEVNDAYRNHTGIATERLVGLHISEVFPDTIPEYLARFASVVATQTASEFETYASVTGRYLHVLTFPAGDNRFANIIEDISERKKAEEALQESNERLRTITTNTPDHILMQDCDLRYQLVINPQLGLSEADMLGKTDHDILTKAEAEKITAIKRKVLETGTRATVESSVLNSKGETEFFEGVYVPKFGPAGQTEGLIGYFRNITKRKIIEDQLAKQTEQLQERSTQMENANRELESFSYSISHDLKAPLRTIDGYSRMLMKKHGGQLSEDAARILNVIRSSTERMGALIDDLLSFSRILRNSMTVSEIDMNKLVSEVWNEIRDANRDRELELKITYLLPGLGDQTLIRQVLVNLFSNAVKFTKNQEPGIIEMTSYSEPGKVVYRFKDNGVGFDMAYYDKLFCVFQRLHSLEEYDGTGIGLAIVQRIINRHGGYIWAEGKVNEGATFYFTLPAK